jgi:hypothetical protein
MRQKYSLQTCLDHCVIYVWVGLASDVSAASVVQTLRGHGILLLLGVIVCSVLG